MEHPVTNEKESIQDIKPTKNLQLPSTLAPPTMETVGDAESDVFCTPSGSMVGTEHIVSNSKIKCRCGCVPDILSMFEMAELRAKKRAEKIRSNAKTA